MAHPRAAARSAALAAALDAIDAGRAPRVLAALEDAYAPLRAKREPYWRAPLPKIADRAFVSAGVTWYRYDYAGPVVTLDRSGSYVAAASSVEIAHGALERTGRLDFAGRPGYYRTPRHPWHESDMPDPLAGARADDRGTVWVTHPVMALLRDLADAGRWSDVAVLDSWTSDAPARLRDWATFVNALREYAITTYGRGSDPYELVKDAYSQATAMLLGEVTPDGGRRWKCKAGRPDWRHAIQAQAVASLWRWADDLRQVAGAELAPVFIGNSDEIVLPAAALPVVTTQERPGGRKPLQLDPTGVALGSFKVKEESTWQPEHQPSTTPPTKTP